MTLKRRVLEPPGDRAKRYCVIGPKMAIDFHVEGRYLAGLEMHYFERPAYMRERAPDFTDCTISGGDCWCDGTSTYASETLLPMFTEMGVDDFWPILETAWRRYYAEAFAQEGP